ncbi:MAG: transposase [SAR324 cluster bacterium]|nr:transposase [SAR324 cluster bacterium]
MARLQRATPAGIPVHLLHRGNNRQACFKNNGDYSAFLWWLREYSEKFMVEIHTWALMENHYHLLCTPQIEDGLSRMVQALGRQYVRYFNRLNQRTGTLWEGRYRSCLVQPDSYLLEVYRYIELNPVRAALASNPVEFNWSSYQINASGKPSALCKPHAEYLKLGETRAECAENYKLKCESGLDEKRLEEIRKSINKGLAFGDEEFKIEVEELTGRRQRALKSGRPVGWRKEK